MAEPAVDGHQSGRQVALAVAPRGFPHGGGTVGVGREIGALDQNPPPAAYLAVGVVVDRHGAVQSQHRPGQLVDVWGFLARGHDDA